MTYNAGTQDRVLTRFIAIHCSASRPSGNAGAVDIDQWHRKRGFRCIGYHKVIRRDGTIEDGRPIEQIGAHIEGWNSLSVGICLVGGVSEKDGVTPENNFTPAQFDSLKGLILELQKKYPKAITKGHRDFPDVKKACPSFSVADWMKEVGLKNPE